MTTTSRVALVGAVLLVAGVATGAYLVTRDDVTLPPMAVETIAPATDAELPRTLVVEPSGTCPGYTVKTPAARRVGPAGSTSTALMLDADGSAVVLTCMGTTEHFGPLRELVAKKLRNDDENVRTLRIATEVHSPYGTAIRTESIVGAKALTEWFTERDGTTWGVGYLHREDEAAQLDTVEAMLASWSWS